MELDSAFKVVITKSEIIVRFPTGNYPTEVAVVERANQKLDATRQAGDPQRITYASMELQQSILALLRAPSNVATRAVGGFDRSI